MESFLRDQMRTPYFPIDFNTFQADISFVKHAPGDAFDICDSMITVYKQNHPGDSYGYRVDQEDKSIVSPLIRNTPMLHMVKSTIISILSKVLTFSFSMLHTRTLNRYQPVNTEGHSVM